MNQQLNFDTLGTLNIRILDQSEIWRDRNGFVQRLEELDTFHLQCIPNFLLRKGNILRTRWILLHQIALITAAASGIEGWDEDRTWDGFGEKDRPLTAWLEDRPLVKRINQILKERGETYD